MATSAAQRAAESAVSLFQTFRTEAFYLQLKTTTTTNTINKSLQIVGLPTIIFFNKVGLHSGTHHLQVSASACDHNYVKLKIAHMGWRGVAGRCVALREKYKLALMMRTYSN